MKQPIQLAEEIITNVAPLLAMDGETRKYKLKQVERLLTNYLQEYKKELKTKYNISGEKKTLEGLLDLANKGSDLKSLIEMQLESGIYRLIEQEPTEEVKPINNKIELVGLYLNPWQDVGGLEHQVLENRKKINEIVDYLNEKTN